MGIIYQFLGLGYPSSTETEVSFVGLKSYDTIKITLGDVSYEGGKIVYKVTKPVAVPSTSPNTKSNFRLPINIKNLNEKDNEGGGLSITNISIGTGSDREGALNMEGAKGDPVLEDTHVWAYVNRTSGRRVNKDPDIFLFEAQQIGPLCNRDSPCNLGPEEEITVFAENFVGGDKKAMSYGWVDDKCISPYDEDDCPVSYQNRIPCEDKNMQSFEFEIKIKYDFSVAHTRTLVVANTRNDGYTASEQGAIVDILEEVPTDGPMDLIINFNSPYILEEMQAIPKGTVGRNIITMTVGVQNGNENSKYRPYKGDNPYTITIKPIGDEFPSWLTGVSGDCIDHENENGNIDQIGIRNGEFYLNDMVPLETRDQFLEEDVSFVCDLQIDIEGARNDVASYKSISFVGKLTYNYIEEKTFFGYRNSVDVDKQFCPDCPYDCIEREVCGEENCLEEYYCPNADRMCCCR
jgi:hypothetical protein